MSLILFLESSKYVLLALGSFIEGSVVMLTGGFLLRLGQVDLVPLFLALYAGDILSDIVLYAIGYFGARTLLLRFGSIIHMTPLVIAKIERLFTRHHTSILLVSKLTMGFGFAYATLLTAGSMRIPFVRYMAINAFGGLIWVSFLIVVGYTFGNIFDLVPRDLKIAFALVLLVSVILAFRWMSRRFAQIDW